MRVTVRVNGIELGSETIAATGWFDLGFGIPKAVGGAPEMRVEIEVGRTFTPDASPRELGLSFGVIELESGIRL